MPSRFTFHDQVDFFPVWSPDGQRVVFCSNRNGTYDLFEKPASGAGEEKLMEVAASEAKLPMDLSTDGRFLLVYVQSFPGTGGHSPVSSNGGTQVRWRPDGKSSSMSDPIHV